MKTHFTANEVAASLYKGAPVIVRFKDTLPKEAEKYEGTEIFGYYRTVRPNEKINPGLIDSNNGWHWLMELADPHNDGLVNDIHLELIDSVTIYENIRNL